MAEDDRALEVFRDAVHPIHRGQGVGATRVDLRHAVDRHLPGEVPEIAAEQDGAVRQPHQQTVVTGRMAGRRQQDDGSVAEHVAVAADRLDLDDDAFPTPSVDPALIEGKEVETKEAEPAAVETPKVRLEAKPQPAPLLMRATPPPPPMPQQKPALPALKEQTAAAPAEAAKPLRRGEMEPIDDYRPKKPSSVVVDPTALDRALMPATEKPARTPIPQPKPAAPKPKAEAKVLAKGEMEPVDDVPGPKALVTRPGEASTFRCFVRDVMAFYDRTHIRCYNKARSKLNFFAVDTAQPISASVVSKGLAAMQAGKPAIITFAPESDLNPSNCAAANCRRLIDIQN